MGEPGRVELGPLHTAAAAPAGSAGVPLDHTAEAPAVAALVRRGFTASFMVDGDRLRICDTDRRYRPQDVTIRDYYRFEGTSDPDDMSVVYALETRDGVLGTLIDAFGAKADPAIATMLDRMRVERPGERPPLLPRLVVALGIVGLVALAIEAALVTTSRRSRRA